MSGTLPGNSWRNRNTLIKLMRGGVILDVQPTHSENVHATAGMGLAAERTLMLSLCLLVTSITLLFSQAAITDDADGRSMYEVTKSIVEHGSFALEGGFPGRDGKYYASHGLGLPLAAIFPYVAARPLMGLSVLGKHATEAAVASLIPLVTGLVVVALYRLARRLGADANAAVPVAVGAAFGTYLLTFSKEFFSEPLATLFLVLAIERAVAKRPTASGVAAAGAALTRPQFFAVVPILLWRLWRDCGSAAVITSAVPLLVGLLLTVGYNVARFGDPANFGYAGLGFTTPFLRGAGGLLFHPDKSIFLFAPVVILIPFGLRRLWDINRTAFWLLTGNLVLTFVTLATWVDWFGGWVWGPRPLLPGIIPAIAGTASWVGQQRLRRLLVLSLFVIGFLVSAPTLVISQRAQLIGHPPPYGPNVLRQVRLIPETFRFTREHVLGPTSGRDRYEQYVNTWQVTLIRVLGRRGVWPASALSLLLIMIAALSTRKVWELLRKQ